MAFPPETSQVSHTIAFHVNLFFFELTDFFPSGTLAGSAGPSLKFFWYVVGSMKASRGHTYWYFFSYRRNLSYSRGVIVLYGLTGYILDVFASHWGVISKLCWKKMVGTLAVDNACARREQRLANIMKPTCHLNVFFSSLRNFRTILAWNMIGPGILVRIC